MPIEIKQRGLVSVLKHIGEIDTRVARAGAIALRRGLEYARTIAQREYLSGPRPARLDVRTTRLRQSIAVELRETPRGTIGRIGSNVKYAGFHEFGFHGTMRVKGFTRVINQVNAAGNQIDTRRPLVDRAGNVIGYRESRKRSASRQASGFAAIHFVSPHERKVNYPGRPFIRPALQRARPLILAAIREELGKLSTQ